MSLKIIPLATLLASPMQSKAIVEFFLVVEKCMQKPEGLFDRSCSPTQARRTMNCVKS